MPEGGDLKPWELLERHPLGDYRVFTVRKDICRSPRTGRTHEFFVLEGSNWVNVVALTARDEVVWVRQFRHGTGEITLEIPGGCIDPADPDPLAAAKRELLEETGYVSDDWVGLGSVDPNPAIQANTCFTFLARNARKSRNPEPDGTEDIRVELSPRSEISTLIRSGRIRHALVVVALHFLLQEGAGAISKA